MTTNDTNVQNLIINTLTKAQYEAISTPSNTELYLTPDTTTQDIADAISTHNSSSSAHPDIRALMSGGTSRNIGEIITSTIPLTDAGLHLLDGALLQYASYKDFIDYIASIYDASANYFCTEADWQTAVTNYGVCGKFVYNSTNNTVRLPKYNSKIYTGGGEAPVKGNGNSLGLTNGTINVGLTSQVGWNTSANGAVRTADELFNVAIGSSITSANNAIGALGVTPDGTKSGIITDLSNITTSLDSYYYIVIANSTNTEIQVDIDEIATDLNGKADTDLSNINPSQSIKNTIIGWSLPNWNSVTSIALSTNHTASTNGYLWCYSVNNSSQYSTLTINGNTYSRYTGTNNNGYSILPICKGDTYNISSTGTLNAYFITVRANV